MDRRLFLPAEWAADAPRQAGVPRAIVFRTKPELALEMVADAAAAGRPFRWVAGDGLYGDIPTFCRGVRALGEWYVHDSSADARVWRAEPGPVPPGRKPTRGRPTINASVTTKPERVDEVGARPPASAWRRVAVAEGSQGPIVCDHAEVAACFNEKGMPGGPGRLLVRRSIGQQPELKYHRTNAPPEVLLAALAGVRSKRWSIGQDF